MREQCRGLSCQAIRHDVFDRVAYDNIYAQSKDLQTLIGNGKSILGTMEELSVDIFSSLYRAMPELAPESEVMPEYLLNHAQMAKILESTVYHGLREYTQRDEFGAGLGSKALIEGLLKEFSENHQLQQVVRKVNCVLEKKNEAEKLDKHTDDFQRAMSQAKATMDDVKTIITGMQSVLRRTGEKVIGAAASELEETESVILSWGLHQGEFTYLPYDRKVELIKILRGQQKFRDLTKLVGRMRNIARASRKVKLQQRIELHSITQGNDLNHILSQELLALRKPALKLDFYRKMAEKQLMQYDLQHKEYVGQGPILALVDTSSSMRGEREVWAKAVAVGLSEIAEKEHRAFGYALFSSKHRELITDTFAIGKRSPDKLIRLATEFLGGGTDYVQPLNWGMQQLQESRFNKADIVFITDGECQLSDAFLKELLKVKLEKQFRIYSILIGGTPCELSRWSDDVWSITDLLDESMVKELFQKI